jgi:type I restriction enzyme M protein
VTLQGAGTHKSEARPRPAAVIVQQGKVLDFIDGVTQRNETPEEYVRQEIAKSLVREYSYPKPQIAVEFTLRLGSRKPRADLVIFPGGAGQSQANASLVIECKAQSVKADDRKEGVGQLQSYMAACANVSYGMWTNGLERYCYRKVVRKGPTTLLIVSSLAAQSSSLVLEA